jgi:hypothetical protein
MEVKAVEASRREAKTSQADSRKGSPGWQHETRVFRATVVEDMNTEFVARFDAALCAGARFEVVAEKSGTGSWRKGLCWARAMQIGMSNVAQPGAQGLDEEIGFAPRSMACKRVLVV